MKKLLLILIALPMFGFGQNVNIPDANFKAYLVGNSAVNTNGDSEIQVSEAVSFSDSINCWGQGISNLTGIEAFTTLTYLDCSANNLTSLDVSNNTALIDMDCEGNQLTSLDVSINTTLKILDCDNNQLTNLDISNNISLTNLDCVENQLSIIDVSSNTALQILECSGNQLTSLDVSQNTALVWLECCFNQLTSLDVSQNTELRFFLCFNNQLTTLDVSNNPDLFYFWCIDNQLTSLDVRNGNNSNLSYFQSYGNSNLFCINVDDAVWSTANWTAVNNNIDAQQYFSNNCSGTSIQEHTTNKELLKVTGILGRETKQTNQPLFYIYDDGTVEKRIVIE